MKEVNLNDLTEDNLGIDAEEVWRSEIQKITLRINGVSYKEAFNRVCDLDLNLILYLIKFLSIPPETASRAVYFREYCLYNAT
jgi:hypothetical protein